MSNFTDQELNSIKEKISKTYLHALCAKLNYGLDEAGRDFDGFGMDYSVRNISIGSSERKATTPSEEIKVQLKGCSISSRSMIRETENSIKYNLRKDLASLGPNFYIFLVRLPEEEKIADWIRFLDDSLILQLDAYFYEVPLKKGLEKGFITIPKENILTPDNFKKLFICQ